MDKKKNEWPDLAIGLYDKLTCRNAEITYQFEDMTIDVPSGTNSEDSARWKVDGKVSISTKEHKES